ncbi:MAG TPA: thymidine phosphorylase [Blastocatellia bacterium]|jgi:pyrimidine-nucleoside phosphorylase|nr:thymidine phosphorylase [Blastocatellia bacterium]
MRAIDIIAKKRDGAALSREEIKFFITGYTEGEIEDYQMSALLMAVFLRGMSNEETLALTEEMLYSGAVVDFSDLNRPRIDKHSTGGVGDKTSLVIAPVVAAAGILVPMISGRALAHSGGTLDKLESIPGFRTGLSLDEFRSTLARVGAALIGQTAEIAPADKRLYSLRDVTATVPCRPLMAASIMSKKMAEGISGLVLDVKVGSGAFLKTEDEARALASVMIDIARGMGKDSVALITDMNQPLGRMVGNSLEVVEAFDALRGEGPEDFIALCRELSAEMILMGGEASDLEEARRLYDSLIESNAAREKMSEIIEAQGGDPSVLDDYSRLPHASLEQVVEVGTSGYVQTVDTEAIGHASMLLGAGRSRLDTAIDLSVGMRIEARIGDRVEAGDALATLFYNDPGLASDAAREIRTAFGIGPEPVEPPRLIKAVLR